MPASDFSITARSNQRPASNLHQASEITDTYDAMYSRDSHSSSSARRALKVGRRTQQACKHGASTSARLVGHPNHRRFCIYIFDKQRLKVEIIVSDTFTVWDTVERNQRFKTTMVIAGATMERSSQLHGYRFFPKWTTFWFAGRTLKKANVVSVLTHKLQTSIGTVWKFELGRRLR